MNKKLLWANLVIFLLLVSAAGLWAFSSLVKPFAKATTIEAAAAAEFIHAVIEAQRTVYATNVVDFLQSSGVVDAGEHWKDERSLPLPAQMILDGGRLVSAKGIGLKYRLASLTPIYVWNLPQSDFERKGLEAVAKFPEEPFKGFFQLGQQRYFQAIYADLAVSEACVKCHNAHPNSPRRDYKKDDVMGGIIITFPVKE